MNARTPSGLASDSSQNGPSLAARAFVFAVVLLEIGLMALGTPNADQRSGSALAEILWAVMYAVAIAGLVRTRERTIELLRRSPLIVAFVLLAIVSTMWSIDPAITLRRSLGLAGTTACAYFIVSRFTLEQFLDVYGDVVALVAVLSLIVIVAAPDLGIMQVEYPGSWRGVFNHKNLFGLFLCTGMFTLVARNSRNGRWRSPAEWALLALCLFEFVRAGSITAAIALMLCLGVMSLRYAAQAFRHYRLIIGAIVAVAGVIWTAFWLTATSPAIILSAIGRNATFTGRTGLWPMAWHAITQRPLLGYGYDVFWEPTGYAARYIAASIGWQPPHAHDGFLDVTIDLGVCGLILLGWVLVSAIRTAGRYAAGSALFARTWPIGIVAYAVVSNFTETTLARYNTAAWVLLVAALVYAAPRIVEGNATAASGMPGRSNERKPQLLHAASDRGRSR